MAEPRPYQELGRRVAQRRKQLHLSQREIAPLCHIDESYVAQIELGRRRPPPEVLRQLASVLRLTYAELAELSGYQDRPVGDVKLITTQDRLSAGLERIAKLPAEAIARLVTVAETFELVEQRDGEE